MTLPIEKSIHEEVMKEIKGSIKNSKQKIESYNSNLLTSQVQLINELQRLLEALEIVSNLPVVELSAERAQQIQRIVSKVGQIKYILNQVEHRIGRIKRFLAAKPS
mmetsp:Transcript_22575/g.40014  ORF Transcript_22575/g.40014 Transcript_22575/m.40014 type:complete len:106 (-) Transcript_22575:187-504(-)